MNVLETWNTLCWHLIHTHPREEARAEGNLRTLNIETYVPRYRLRRRHNQPTGARSDQYKPLFPRYVFAHFRVNELYHKVRFTRGVRDLVCFDEQPARVDDEIIAVLRSWQTTNAFIGLQQFNPGDKVVIKEGPFERLSAIFERSTSDRERVVLLLESVGYQARVIVDRDSIARNRPDAESQQPGRSESSCASCDIDFREERYNRSVRGSVPKTSNQ